MAELYNWKRFWCPRSGDIRFDWRGYLSDPESDWGKYENPNLVTLDRLTDVPCLVLLGEPGIGKSQEMTDLVNHAAGSQSHSFVEINLRSCSHLASDLIQEPDFVAWMDGNDRLYLFLDSLDEGLLEARNLAVQIVDEFRKTKYRDKIDRLYLRIACRTAVSPQVLEEGLKEIWGKEKTDFYELAPLRQVDVEVAADRRGIDAQTFLAEIDRKKITSFAIKPITLKFLINRFKNHNCHFPDEQSLADIYLDGCRTLCEDPNPSRRVGLTRKLEVEQRLIVAARIAAVTIFANRFAVWTEPDNGDIPVEDVLIGVLAVQSETARGNSFPVSEDVIREVLDTGLFSSRGVSGRMGWAHQTYAEFLAAWYLQTHNLSLDQILSFILNGNRVIPQLQETVKWLANAREDVFDAVLKTDPDVLLYSEAATASDRNKEMVIAAILNSHDLENLPYRHEIRSLYKNFTHPSIDKQLKSYLCDTEKNTICRMVAIDIAQACHVAELQKYLAIIALNIQEVGSLRLDAALAICHIGDSQTKANLQPLAFLLPSNDIERELKGVGLMAIWPDSITADKLFDSVLNSTNAIGVHGQSFIAYKIVDHLKVSDLPIALRWLKSQAKKLKEGELVYDLDYPFSELSNAILIKAWQHLENPDILKSFTDIALIRLQSWKPIIGSDTSNEKFNFQEMLKNDEKRHYLVESIIGLIPESDFKPYLFTRNGQRIIFERDLNWLVSKSYQISSPDFQKKWAALARFIFNWDDPEKVKTVLENCKNNSFLHAKFCKLLEPIDLSSEEAQDLRNSYLEDKQREEERIAQKNFVVVPSPRERIVDALHQMDEDVNAWYTLCREMTLKPNSTHYSNPFVEKLTDLPGWEEAEAETRLRILNAAKTYVEQAQLTEQTWLGTDSFPHAVLAGYQALALLYEADHQGAFQSVSSDIWRKWTAIILDYPQWNTTEASKHIRQALLLESYKHAPSEFRRVFSTLIDAENKQFGSIHINKLVRDYWDIELIKMILAKVRNPDLTAASFSSLLEDLLIYKQSEAKAFAVSIITFPLPTSEQEREKVIAAARALILYSDDAGWPTIWPVIQKDPEFGRAVLEAVSYVIKFQSTLEQRIPEDCIADLYVFLVNAYPQETKADASDSESEDDPLKDHTIEPEDSVKMWKDYIPQRLQGQGTPESCAALRKIIKELPELKEKLQWRLLDAEALTRRNNWNPPAPEDLLQVVLTKEPSNSALLEKLQQMKNDPKTVINNNITNSQINAPVGNSGPTSNQVTVSRPAETKTISWSGWVAVLLAIIAILTGIFNQEANQWIKQRFNLIPPAKIEPQSQPPSK
jgi:predicted NACHT family NTPase